LQKKQRTIELEIRKNGMTLTALDCKILTSKRSKFERYISKEWCGFVKQKKIKVGDKLIFKISKPSSRMMLRIIHV
jgi:hypothetical protein